MTEQISNAEITRSIIDHLSEESPYYPGVVRKEYFGIVYYSTKLRMESNGFWYTKHHIETTCVAPDESNELSCLMLLMNRVYTSQMLGRVSNMDSLDTLQISEVERIKSSNPYF